MASGAKALQAIDGITIARKIITGCLVRRRIASLLEFDYIFFPFRDTEIDGKNGQKNPHPGND
jgi:hypothetical protein